MSMYNPFSLEGKTILVTGASSGIGRAVAVECSRAGAVVVVTGRDEGRLQETFHALEGVDHISCVTDISTEEGRETLLGRLPALDGVVHAAGICKMLPFQFVNREDMNRIFDVNFFAPILLTKELVKSRKLRKGCSVVIISSVAGSHIAHVGNSMYSASKGALNGAARCMALELAPKKIRVNCILPGMIETPLIQIDTLTDEQLKADLQAYPLNRYGKPEEIAYSVRYFLSDASEWVTGCQFVIDGGLTLQ